MTHRPRFLVGVVVILATSLIAGCGMPRDTEVSESVGETSSTGVTSVSDSVRETSSTGVTSTTSPNGDVACSVSGGTAFSRSFLDGPRLTREELVETPIGIQMESFFVDGPGAAENHQYLGAEGFSIVSDSLVLGYTDGLPDSSFHIEDGQVAGWGGCNPNVVADGLVAGRWEPAGPVDITATSFPIHVDGGACETAGGREVLTEMAGIDVAETEDEVTVTAWTRDEPFEGMCAGVGIVLDSTVELTSPLGERALLNGGPIPPTVVDFVASDGPPPSTTVAGRAESSLGRLDCSPATVVEDRVPDRGQDPLEIAQGAAPGVVEVEPGRPLWWWGVDDVGKVIVGVALGDSDGADYQVWTCD